MQKRWYGLSALVFLFFLFSNLASGASSFAESVKKGASIFNDYCAGCHRLGFYAPQMAADLQLKELPALTKPVLSTEDAQKWFGRQPPDLSLIARQRGSAWIQQFLHGFYEDETRPFGTNNLLLPDLAMPNILESLLGQKHLEENGSQTLNLAIIGKLSPEEAQVFLKDLTHFLHYVAEPARISRYQIGVGVISVLVLLLVLIWRLNRLYFKPN